MASPSMCARCLRSLHRAVRTQNVGLSRRHNDRTLSTASRQLQQPDSPRSANSSKSSGPLPPTATSAVTANPTASPPRQPDDGPSTAEMQRAIRGGLSTSLPPASRGASLTDSLAKTLRRTAKGATETYITYGITESLFKSCSAQADYTIPEEQRQGILSGSGPRKTGDGEDLGVPTETSRGSWWLKEAAEGGLGLPPTFSTWSQVAYLHMYLLTVRLRALPTASSFQNYQRYLSEHFSHAAEDKMTVLHGMGARGIRNRYLKDLFLQWRGILAAYDEGLVSGDAVLAGAVWRNLYKGDENVDWTRVAMVVGWMRTAIALLDKVDVEELVRNLDGKNGVFAVARRDVQANVAKRSQGLTEHMG